MKKITVISLLALAATACDKDNKSESSQPIIPEESLGIIEPTTGEWSEWIGFCKNDSENALALRLQSDGNFSLAYIDNDESTRSESGKYVRTGKSLKFADSTGLLESMSCDLDAGQSGTKEDDALRCSLLRGNSIQFFDDCNQADFVYQSDSKNPADPSVKPGPDGEDVVIPELPPIVIVTPGDEVPTPVEACNENQTLGNLAETWIGTCDGEDVTLLLSDDGLFGLSYRIYDEDGQYCLDSRDNITLTESGSLISPVKCNRTSRGTLRCTGIFACSESVELTLD